MRLWSLHPKYLDRMGLLAVWREGLLAKKVLEGSTKGYRNHPQLIRFRQHKDPLKAINYFLEQIFIESDNRGYSFQASKFNKSEKSINPIQVTSGQIEYEWQNLLKKIKIRDVKLHQKLIRTTPVEINPLFKVTRGNVEEWEIIK